jgi:hypothetical protein
MQQAALTPEHDAFHERKGGFNKLWFPKRLSGALATRPTTYHRNFQRYLKTFGLITMVGMSANLAMSVGEAQARGDFSLSCTNIQLHAVDFSKTAMLRADCKRKDQRDPKNAVHHGGIYQFE